MGSLLEIQQLSKRFGGLLAVNNVSFVVHAGEILSVIGPNGAGKSTLFKLISSFLRPSEGQVLFQGERISHLAPHLVARKGVVRTFQETTIFKTMTVRDNVIVAHHLRSKANLLDYVTGSSRAKQDLNEFADSADTILKLLNLYESRNELASNLPHGYLRALGIAIGLATGPAIILLDEPFAGMNHEETMRAVEMVRRVRDRGVTILLVEHDMHAVMKISDRIVVLNFGEQIAEGTPEQIRQNEKVIEAYLGVEDESIGM
ncbi:MAG: ABC transporter ATP-binding protein [Trueperaceae bacterium]|nr:ABC transporter ATP-binding protein [Trueperaceae bacterium]